MTCVSFGLIRVGSGGTAGGHFNGMTRDWLSCSTVVLAIFRLEDNGKIVPINSWVVASQPIEAQDNGILDAANIEFCNFYVVLARDF
ncbi:hypothetical protein BASA83_004075 [Batrachochytrium salamandrivorans]|nr:hypothetical protein BASA83_004075 [Batrachochytrium salamandrivorans]